MADQVALRVLWQMYVVSMSWASLKLVQHIERICLFGCEMRCSPLWPNHMASLNKIESQIHTGGRRGGRWMGRVRKSVRKRAMLTHQFYQWLSSKSLQYITPHLTTTQVHLFVAFHRNTQLIYSLLDLFLFFQHFLFYFPSFIYLF